MDESQVNTPIDLHHRPQNAFTFVVADLSTARALCDELALLDVDVSQIRLLDGPDGESAFGQEPEGTGWFARLLDSMNSPVGHDSDVVTSYRDALRLHRTVMLVPLGDGKWDALADALRARGARGIQFYGHSSVEDVNSTS